MPSALTLHVVTPVTGVPTVGLVSIGQSPRDDVRPEMAGLLPRARRSSSTAPSMTSPPAS